MSRGENDQVRRGRKERFLSRVGHQPIWSRPEPGSRRPRLTREQIAAAALAIADREGFEAVTMRRLARELRSGTMSLYHYIRTKDDLVDLMDDAILGESLLPDGELPEDWHAALMEIGRRTGRVLARHPWAINALQGAMPGPNAMRHMAQSTAAVSRTGLDQADQIELLALVDDYVSGYALRMRELRERLAAQADPQMIEWVRAQVASGQYEGLDPSAVADDPIAAWAPIMAKMVSEERFERGLKSLLDGARTVYGLP